MSGDDKNVRTVQVYEPPMIRDLGRLEDITASGTGTGGAEGKNAKST
jgi:hypothetical protein